MALQGQAKTDYQREYMRRRRAAQAAKPASKPAHSDDGDAVTLKTRLETARDKIEQLKARNQELKEELTAARAPASSAKDTVKKNQEIAQGATRTVDLEELILKLRPILKALKTEGDKKHAALIAPIHIQTIANDLQKCLNEWILPMEKRQWREHPRRPGALTSLTTKQKRALTELLGS
jgi:hypothetical protein